QIALFSEEGRFVQRVFFSNDAKSVVLWSTSKNGGDRWISVFDIGTGQAVCVVHQSPFPLLVFPVGVFPVPLVQVRIMPVGYPSYGFQNCSISPNGKWLYFDSPCHLENWVIVRDISARQVRQNLNQWPLAVSPDCQFCVLPELDPESQLPI